MSDSWIKSLVELVRDALLPEVRDLKADVREVRADVKALSNKIDNMEATGKARHEQVIAMLDASRSQSELASYREIARVSERVAVLENAIQRQ